TLYVFDALRFLQETLGAPVPPEVTAALGRTLVCELEQMEYQAMTGPLPRSEIPHRWAAAEMERRRVAGLLRPSAMAGAEALASAATSSPPQLSLTAEPLVSCLGVTENRHAFVPWLLWSYDKQDWKRRELVIVDSSDPPISVPDRPDVRVLRVPPGTELGK